MCNSVRLARALAAGALAFATTASAIAGTVNYPSFYGEKVTYHDVTESGPDIPPGLFVPKTPTVANSPVSQLNFFPEQFVQTDESTMYQLKTKSSLLSIGVSGNGDSPSSAAYALTGMKFNIGGSYSLYAPLAADYLFAGSPASLAKIAQAATYTVQVTGVNWAPFSSAYLYEGALTITPAALEVRGPQAGYVSGNWSGSSEIDWNAVRAATGIGAGDYITDVRIQLTAEIAAVGVYGYARTSLTNFSVENATAAVQPVPEPPTIILAGLGAVAVVANGYRRKKQRRVAEAEMSLDAMEETGAIVLTA